MRTSKENWSELGDRIDALALKLKMHLEQAGADEVPQALRTLRDSVADAFEAAGKAVRDDAVRADVRQVGQLFADAMSNTFADVSRDVKTRMERKS